MVGRPSDFTQELADTICERLIKGESLRSICREDEMPNITTVWRWTRAHEAFCKQYADARELQAEAYFDEILDIADDGQNDWMLRNFGEESRWVENGEALQRSRLRVDARKWVISKMLPKKYGEKLTADINGAVTINIIGPEADL